MTETIKDKTFDEERALYGSHAVKVINCRFQGPADGESALKESKIVRVDNCYFDLRYPFWHNTDLQIHDSEMTEKCRAPLWYSRNVVLSGVAIHGPKAVRECDDVSISSCSIVSQEFGWRTRGISMKDTTVESEYFMFCSQNLDFSNVALKGKYSFQYISDSLIENSNLDTKDSLWHARNVIVRNCRIKGEYLAWYCDNVVFENCHISGTQPLCYCKNLKMINCTMTEADLCFEKSQVDATITTPLISIKNPTSGCIRVPSAEQIIMDDAEAKCKITMTQAI